MKSSQQLGSSSITHWLKASKSTSAAASAAEMSSRVFSIPCISAHLGQKQLRKPSDSGYDQFWVDFNVGSERISVFCEQDKSECQESQEDDFWETISISKPDMRRCFSYEIPGKFVVNFELIAPLCEIYPSQQNIHESTMKIEFPIEYTSIIEEALKRTFRLEDQSSNKQRKVSVVSEVVNISRIEESPIQQAEKFSSADICPPTQVSTSSQVSTTTKRKVSVPCTPMRAPILIAAPVNIDRSTSLASIQTQPDTVTTEPIRDAQIMLKNKNESQKRKSSCEASSLSLKHDGKTPLTENEQAGSAKMLSKRNGSKSKVKTPVVVIHPTADQKRSKKKDKNQLDSEIRHPEDRELNHQTICCDDQFAEIIPDSLQVPKPQDVTLCVKPTDKRLNLHDSGIDLNETASLLDVSKPKESLENATARSTLGAIQITSEKGIIVQNDKEYARSCATERKKQLEGEIANLSKNNNGVSGKVEVSKKYAQNWAERESNQETDVNEEDNDIKDKRSKRTRKMNRTNKHDQIEADNVDDIARNQKEKTRKRTVKNKGNLVYSKIGGEMSGPKSSVMFAPELVKLDESCKLRVSTHEEKGLNREDVQLNLKNNAQISDIKQNDYHNGRRNKVKKKKRKEKNEQKEVSGSEEIGFDFDDHLFAKEENISALNVNEDQGIKRNKETKKEEDNLSEKAVLDNIEPHDPFESLEYVRSKKGGSRHKNDLGMENEDQDGEDYSSVPLRMVDEASGKKSKTNVKGRKVKKKKESSEPEPKESYQLEEKLAPKQVLNAINAEETESVIKGKGRKDETKVVKESASSPKQNQTAIIKKDTNFEKLLEAELQESSYVFNKQSREENKKNNKNETKESSNEKPEKSNSDKERKPSDKSTIDWRKKKRSLYSDGKGLLQEGKLTDDLKIPAFDEVFRNKDSVSKGNVKDTNTSLDTIIDKTNFTSKKNSRKVNDIRKNSANLTHDNNADEDDAEHHQSEKFTNKLAITDLSSSKNKMEVESKNTTCDNIDNSCSESCCEDTISMTTMTKTAVQKIDESRMAIFMSYSAQKTYSHRSRASNRYRPWANSDSVNEKHISPDRSNIFSNKMKTSRIFESKIANGTGFMHEEEKVHQNQIDKCKEKSVAEYDPYDFELECEQLSQKSERLIKCEEAHAVFKKDNTSKNNKSEKSTKAKKQNGSLMHDKKTNIWKRKSLEESEGLRSGVNMQSHHFIHDGSNRGSSPNKKQKKSLKVQPLSECQKFEWESHFEDCDVDNSKQHKKINNIPNKIGQNERHNDEMKRKSVVSKTNKSKLGKQTANKNEMQKDFENDNTALKGKNNQERFNDEFKALDIEHEQENKKKMEYHKNKKEREPPKRKNTEIDSRETACQQPFTSSIVDNFSKIFKTIVSAGESGDLENNDKNGKDRSIGKNDTNEIVEEESCSDDQVQNIDNLKVQAESSVGSARSKRKYGFLDISLVKTPQSLQSAKETLCSSEVQKSCSEPKNDDQPVKDNGAGISDLDSFCKWYNDTNEKSWIKAFKDPQRKLRIKKTYTKGYIKSGQLEELEKELVNQKLLDKLPTEPTPQDASTNTPIIIPCIKIMSGTSTPGLTSKTLTSSDMNDIGDIEMVPSQLTMDDTSAIDAPYLKKPFGISKNKEDDTSTVDTPYLKKLFSISENKEDEESNNEAESVGNLLSFIKTVQTHHRGSELKSDDSTPSASSQESCNNKTEQETSHFIPRKLFKNFLPESDRNMQVKLLSQKDSEEIFTCTTEDEQLQLEVMCEAEVTGVSKLMQAFGTDFQKHLTFKHQRLEMLGREALGSVQHKLSQSWKDQRQNRLNNMKELQSTLKDWLQRAEKECDVRKGNNIEFLRNEMKNLQKKILIETQKEELLNVRRCLQSLF
ncbi:hypothetical protein CHS0354_016442 [Potamilus streckersoni]|uniref:Synaptonemal complex protein 2 Spt16M-like domain-containing protein n=1 Tax=Potamilus streckersoni TaxID=2493646 RepID=A0AAE0TJG2_9BIVA|nr:hypothetical protein CHS0354_016442 [Potamilus streckersoni]